MMKRLWALGLLLAMALQGAALWVLHRSPPPAHPALAEAWMSRLDTNGDSVLSIDEQRLLSHPGSPSWDLNADGEVTAGELEVGLRMVNPNILYQTAPSGKAQPTDDQPADGTTQQ